MWNGSHSTTMRLASPTSGAADAGFRLYTVEDVAGMLGVPRKSVYGLGIPQVRPGPRTVRFAPSDFSRWLDQRRREL